MCLKNNKEHDAEMLEPSIYHSNVERLIELQNLNSIYLSTKNECIELLKHANPSGKWIDVDRNHYATAQTVYKIAKTPANASHPLLFRITVYELQQ